MNYLATYTYPGDPKSTHTHVAQSTRQLDEFFVELVQKDEDRRLVKLVLIRPELEVLAKTIEAKLQYWKYLRELEKLVGDELDDIELIDAMAVGFDEPVESNPVPYYDSLCELLNGVLENNGVPQIDYTKDVRETPE